MSVAQLEPGTYHHVADLYPKNVLSGLSQLRAAGTLCDVKLSVGGQLFPAHRVMLCAASTYFQAMFTGDMVEQHKDTINIHEIQPVVFGKLLDFIYTGELSMDIEDCQDLLAAADLLGLKHVIEACCHYMKLHLHPSNCIGIHLFADAHGCLDLLDASETYINNHFLQVAGEEEYMDLPCDVLIRFLNSDLLHVEKEYQVFTSAMSWLLHEPPARRRHIFDIMATVRFPLITSAQLDKYIEECSDISLKVALGKIVQDIFRERQGVRGSRLAQLKPYLFQPRRHSLRKVYIVGGIQRQKGGRWADGETLSQMDCFNTFEQSWRKSSEMHHSRSGHGVAVLNGLIYVIGGESDSMIFDEVECFDPSLQKWTVAANMTVPRCGLGVCVVDSAIYALGGWVGAEIGRTVEKYEPQLGCWVTVDEMPKPRHALGVTTSNGLAYVIGGLNDIGLETQACDSYNPVTHEWSSLAQLPTARAYVGVAAMDECIYAAGGSNSSRPALDVVERYSIEQDCWSELPSLRHARAGPSVVAVNGFVYVIGGRTAYDEFTAPSTLDSVECYDPQSGTWFEICPMPSGRCEAGVAVL